MRQQWRGEGRGGEGRSALRFSTISLYRHCQLPFGTEVQDLSSLDSVNPTREVQNLHTALVDGSPPDILKRVHE